MNVGRQKVETRNFVKSKVVGRVNKLIKIIKQQWTKKKLRKLL